MADKPLSGPTITFADVKLNKTGKVNKGFPQPWMHVAPIMLIDEKGGIGGLWFEGVHVTMDSAHAASDTTRTAAMEDARPTQPFLAYYQLPCGDSAACPNITGDIRGDIEVEWQGAVEQCIPRLLDQHGVPLKNESVFGHRLLQNVSVSCS